MPKTLKLISLGARGVGKTVFLVSNCASALQGAKSSSQRSLWFECQDQQSKEMVQKLLSYVKQNRTYPPATFKITDFNLSLKEKSRGNTQTLCNVQWSDIPGEWCDLNNQNFQSALLNSHGCCVFVDSEALINDPSYVQFLAQTMKQVESITNLIDQNDLIQYPIALVCTKYDLVQSNSIGLIQLEEKLRPLIQKIESSQGLTKRFYSAIPLPNMQSGALNQKTNANDALMWIISELNAIHGSKSPQNLGQALNRITQESLSAKSSSSSAPSKKGSPRSTFDLSNPKQVIPLALGGCGLLAAAAALFLVVIPNVNRSGINPSTAKRIDGFEEVLKSDPTNESAISGLVSIYADELPDREQDGIDFLETIHQKAPNDINVLNALAQLSREKGDIAKQEEYYDKILKIDNINLLALQGKVQIKVDSGKPDEARAILDQAEKNATTPAYKSLLKGLSDRIPKK